MLNETCKRHEILVAYRHSDREKTLPNKKLSRDVCFNSLLDDINNDKEKEDSG